MTSPFFACAQEGDDHSQHAHLTRPQPDSTVRDLVAIHDEWLDACVIPPIRPKDLTPVMGRFRACLSGSAAIAWVLVRDEARTNDDTVVQHVCTVVGGLAALASLVGIWWSAMPGWAFPLAVAMYALYAVAAIEKHMQSTDKHLDMGGDL